MTRNRPQPARAVPRRPRVCQCSSGSTSFMLAVLRVLHVDPSHTPAEIARIEEQPSQHRRLTEVFAHPNPLKATGPRRRGGGCARSDLRRGYERQRDSFPEATLDIFRPAEALLPNSPSCGNQPANISLTVPVA
jgi:hypothetical protein